MNLTSYDNLISGILDNEKTLSSTDPLKYCEYAYSLLDRVDSTYHFFNRDNILYLHNSLENKQIDDRTLKASKSIINSAIVNYRIKLKNKSSIYEHSLKRQISKYRFNYSLIKLTHETLQFAALAGSIGLPFILNLPDIPKILPTIISITIAIAIGFLKFYKFRERSKVYFLAAEKFNDELNLYQSQRGPYKNQRAGAALELLMDRVDQLKHEQTNIFLTLEEKLSKEQEIELGQEKTQNHATKEEKEK
jgi:hypothetical protein